MAKQFRFSNSTVANTNMIRLLTLCILETKPKRFSEYYLYSHPIEKPGKMSVRIGFFLAEKLNRKAFTK